jgi:hypothetical protein
LGLGFGFGLGLGFGFGFGLEYAAALVASLGASSSRAVQLRAR